MKNNGGSAFPTNDGQRGMSLRDYFAGQALQGVLAGMAHQDVDRTVKPNFEVMVSDIYAIADAMLEERAK